MWTTHCPSFSQCFIWVKLRMRKSGVFLCMYPQISSCSLDLFELIWYSSLFGRWSFSIAGWQKYWQNVLTSISPEVGSTDRSRWEATPWRSGHTLLSLQKYKLNYSHFKINISTTKEPAMETKLQHGNKEETNSETWAVDEAIALLCLDETSVWKQHMLVCIYSPM